MNFSYSYVSELFSNKTIQRFASVGVENRRLLRVRNYILHADTHRAQIVMEIQLFLTNNVYGCVYTTFSNNSAFNELSYNAKFKNKTRVPVYLFTVLGRVFNVCDSARWADGEGNRQRNFENGNLNVFRVQSASFPVLSCGRIRLTDVSMTAVLICQRRPLVFAVPVTGNNRITRTTTWDGGTRSIRRAHRTYRGYGRDAGNTYCS